MVYAYATSWMHDLATLRLRIHGRRGRQAFCFGVIANKRRFVSTPNHFSICKTWVISRRTYDIVSKNFSSYGLRFIKPRLILSLWFMYRSSICIISALVDALNPWSTQLWIAEIQFDSYFQFSTFNLTFHSYLPRTWQLHTWKCPKIIYPECEWYAKWKLQNP